jgi:hypothetical protein
MARAILADINILGHVRALTAVLAKDPWSAFWHDTGFTIQSFDDAGLQSSAPDRVVWLECQRQQLILLIANRNDDGPDSLENTLRTMSTPASLPVFTLANAQRVLDDRQYVEREVIRMLEYIEDLDRVRGTGRLYLP